MSAWMWRGQGQTGKPAFDNKKKHLWERCEYCGKTLICVNLPRSEVAHNSATLDHRTPRSKGGTNEISNLAMVCLTCNQAKADMGFEEFMAYRKELERLRGGLPISDRNTASYWQHKNLERSKLMARFACSMNLLFVLIGGLCIMFGCQILYVEIVEEMHRSTNAVVIGVVMVAYGLHAIQAGINALFLEEG